MDEKFTREKKSSRRRVEPESQTKKKTYGSKLKNDLSRNEAMRKKLRTGRAECSETLQEKKKKDKLRKQGRTKTYAEAAALAKARHQMANHNEDENAGVEAVDTGLGFAEGTLYSRKAQPKSRKSNGYGKKLYQKSPFEEANGAKRTGAAVTKEGTNQVQKNLMKKEIQRQAYHAGAKEAAHGFGSYTAKFVDKAEDLAGKLAEGVIETVKSHPLLCLLAVGIFLLVVGLSSCTSTIGLMGGGISGTTLTTTFTAQDDDIIAVDEAYTDLEAEIQQEINEIETDYPGYDEYNYTLNEISHNPFELAALLTVLYEDYTPGEVASMMQTIKNYQYELTTEEVVETRTRTVTKWHWVTRYRTEIVDGVAVQVPYQSYESYQVEEEYEYYILNVTLVNHGVDYVARNKMNLTAEQLQRYEILLETFGNKKYLFEDNPYAAPNPGDYQDYDVPSEYLTDVEFGNMLHEAEKYLGYPYVWGGSNPSTSFDCSGYVSYVINNCGNGWNVGRQTANGLLNHCTRVSANNAKPGDLIFFQGTYNTSGASHVGIYVGDGMMIHCGNPIQYANINSSYWQSHFYIFGRLNH